MTTYAPYGDNNYKYGNSDRLYGVYADPNTRWGVDVDWDGDGEYDGANEGAYAIGFKSRRGRQNYLNIDSDGNANGFEPIRVGTATLTLDNTTGRYDPYNTSSALYPNVRPGKRIRIRVSNGGIVYDVIQGNIKSIINVDTSTEKKVRIEIEDGTRILQRASTSIAVVQNVTIDAAIGLVLDDVNWPTIFGRNIDESMDVIPFFWADGKAANEIRTLADTELGYFFVAADGKATFFSRHHLDPAVLTLTSSDLLKEIDIPQPWEVIRNTIKLTAHPPILRASGDLWTLQDTPDIVPGGDFTVFAEYGYNNSPCPAINVVTPVATTDYTANSAADGSGTDLTSYISIILTDFGKTGKLVVSNSHPTLTAYITLLKVRGEAVDISGSSLLQFQNATSITDYGEALMTIESPWYQQTLLTSNFAEWLASFMSKPLKFLTVKMEARPDIQFTPDLFDLVDVTISKISISGVNYRVAGIEHEWISIDNGQAVQTTWCLQPNTDLSTDYWQFSTTIGVTSKFGI